jgi:hypothetical protein
MTTFAERTIAQLLEEYSITAGLIPFIERDPYVYF